MSATLPLRRMRPAEIVRNQFDFAADLLGLSREMRNTLRTPFRCMTVKLPVRLGDGSIELFRGYRVQHNGARGPYKGGVRFHPEADEAEVGGMATTMTWKTALLQLPFGGAKGGVQVDPRRLSVRETEAVAREYVSRIGLILGPYRDIPAPDLGTNARVMAWMLDEYSRRNGYTPAVVTGKPLSLGGSVGREDAVGQGILSILGAYGEDFGVPVAGGRVVIQGFGNVGAHTARLLADHGARVVAVSDVDGGLYDERGLDVAALFRHSYLEKQPVLSFDGARKISNDELWQVPCEWLIPAALGGAINQETNADSIDCKVVVEGANSAVTPIADKILERRRIAVLPDFLVNAGGVVVSYFEWVQNLQQHPWPGEQVSAELGSRLLTAYRTVRDLATEHAVTWRTAAYMTAMARVAEAEELRGH